MLYKWHTNHLYLVSTIALICLLIRDDVWLTRTDSESFS